MENLLSTIQEVNDRFLSFMKINTDNFNNTLNIIGEELVWVNKISHDLIHNSKMEDFSNYYKKKTKGKRLAFEKQLSSSLRYLLPTTYNIEENKSVDFNKENTFQGEEDALHVSLLKRKRTNPFNFDNEYNNYSRSERNRKAIFKVSSAQSEQAIRYKCDSDYKNTFEILDYHSEDIKNITYNVNNKTNGPAPQTNIQNSLGKLETRPTSFDNDINQHSILHEVFLEDKKTLLTDKKTRKISRSKTSVYKCSHIFNEHYAKGLCKPCYQHEYFLQFTKPKEVYRKRIERFIK
jgi:hypothetical protein